MSIKSFVRNCVAIVSGFVVGSLINIGIVNVGPLVVPLPEGADVSTMENLQQSMKLFGPLNFLPPFLAHALGTLAGAWIAAKLAVSHPFFCAMGIGFLFLAGGIAVAQMLGGPSWFIVLDLVFAYLPMAYIGARLGAASQNSSELAFPESDTEGSHS